MYWRIGSAYRTAPPGRNKAAFRRLVKRGPPPGLLAFAGDVAVGWCQLTPRQALPWLDRTWRLRAVDDIPIWVISCLYVRIGYRRTGITSLLIAAAIKAAKRAKAPALEAYPLDAERSPSATGTGFASAFARAGFEVIARRTPERPIMRYAISRTARYSGAASRRSIRPRDDRPAATRGRTGRARYPNAHRRTDP